MKRPNIVLVTLDTMRADRVGALRHGIELTPNLSAAAGRGKLFTNAVTAGVPTYFAFPALFLGGGPLDRGKSIGLPENGVTVVEALRDSGYGTAAVIASNPYLSSHYRFDRGFDVFDDTFAAQIGERTERYERASMKAIRRVVGGGGVKGLQRVKAKLNYARECLGEGNPGLHQGSRGEEISRRGIALMDRLEGEKPYFLWLHYMDLHGYYYSTQFDRERMLGAESVLARAVSRYRRFEYVDKWAELILRSQIVGRREPISYSPRDVRYLRAFYDAAAIYADGCLAPLLDRALGRDDTLLIVTSDHGEQFFEHGKIGHAPFALYDEVARVPLILVGANVEPAEESQWVSHSSIAPTIADVAGLSTGVGSAPSLLSSMRPSGPVFTESLYGVHRPFPARRFPEHRLLLACREGSHKYIWCEGDEVAEELYDTSSDPGETRNLIDEPDVAAVAGRLREAVRSRAREAEVLEARARLGLRARAAWRKLGTA